MFLHNTFFAKYQENTLVPKESSKSDQKHLIKCIVSAYDTTTEQMDAFPSFTHVQNSVWMENYL